jgi:hypothetical protein
MKQWHNLRRISGHEGLAKQSGPHGIEKETATAMPPQFTGGGWRDLSIILHPTNYLTGAGGTGGVATGAGAAGAGAAGAFGAGAATGAGAAGALSASCFAGALDSSLAESLAGAVSALFFLHATGMESAMIARIMFVFMDGCRVV